MAFSIPCRACDTAFSLDQELFERRVAGKVVSFKCPSCGEPSVINALDQHSFNAASATGRERPLEESDLFADEREITNLSDAEVASVPPDSLPAAQARPPPRPRLESKIDDELWVVSIKEGAEDQEIFESSLIHLIAEGKMPADAIVWREGMTRWWPLADVSELAKYLPPPPDDKTGGFLGTGMKASFGSNAGERKSTPPPLPPKKSSYGGAKHKSYGSKNGGPRPVALSPGLLFSVDDAASEPPQSSQEQTPQKAVRTAPKAPLRASRRAVTRDLDFSDIAEDDLPLSGTPALKDLTSLVQKQDEAKPPGSNDRLLVSLGTEEEVLGPPSIDISDISGNGPRERQQAPAPASESEGPAPTRARGSEAPRGKQNKKRRAKGRSSKRPPGSSSRRPAAAAASREPKSQRGAATEGKAAAPSSPAPSRSRAGWLTVWRIVALVVIAGLAFALFSRRLKSDRPGAQPELTAARPGALTENQPSAAPEPTPALPEAERMPTEPPTAATQQVQTKRAQQPRAGSAAAQPALQGRTEAPSAVEQQPTTAEAEPAVDKPKPAPKERPPSEQDAPPFDKAAAVSALNVAVAQAAGCRQPGDPSGTARVVITFAPSGRVTTANLSGPPFAGTRTGGCIAATMRNAQVPAFSGSRVTVSKSVVIR